MTGSSSSSSGSGRHSNGLSLLLVQHAVLLLDGPAALALLLAASALRLVGTQQADHRLLLLLLGSRLRLALRQSGQR
jgi:hypothetical protein